MPDGSRDLAIIAHGAGSSADFVRRAFAPVLATIGIELAAIDDRTGNIISILDRFEQTAAAADAAGRRVVLAGGVSLGAHAAVTWATSGRPELIGQVRGLLLCLPAWTGAPGPVASATAAAAADIRQRGSQAVVSELREAAPGDWVVSELARAWAGYSDDLLAQALRTAATQAAPSESELRAIPLPAGIVGFDHDPLHPRAVAERWAKLIPRSHLQVISRTASGHDLRELGSAAVAAWQEAARAAR